MNYRNKHEFKNVLFRTPTSFLPRCAAGRMKERGILRAEDFNETFFDFFVALLELVRIRREKF
jgi:hypothetical protein